MALLDLQGMEFGPETGAPASILGSSNSAGRSCGSAASAALCGGHASTLSVTLCPH